MSTLSFYANKVVTAGEGGAVCFSDENLIDWVNTYINHGMSQAGSYRHELPGSNYRMSSLNAALLCAQLTRVDELIKHRKKLWSLFLAQATNSYVLPVYGEKEVPWLMEIKSLKSSPHFEQTLNDVGVQYRKFFTSMCSQPAFKNLLLLKMENTNEFLDRRYFLPLYYPMKRQEITRITKALF